MNAVRTSVELAGLRRRLTCMLYEATLQIGVLAAGFLLPQMVVAAIGWKVPGWSLWLHVFVVLGMYFLFLWRRNGQTLAMQTLRLQLLDAHSGRLPSVRQCLLRYTLAWPSLLFFGAGLLWSLFDRDRQFLHDRLSGTCVVRLGPPAQNAASAPLD